MKLVCSECDTELVMIERHDVFGTTRVVPCSRCRDRGELQAYDDGLAEGYANGALRALQKWGITDPTIDRIDAAYAWVRRLEEKCR